jgi:hypothetical protein
MNFDEFWYNAPSTHPCHQLGHLIAIERISGVLTADVEHRHGCCYLSVVQILLLVNQFVALLWLNTQCM